MIGSAKAFGAITITNALPTGIGCAAGIELPVEARVVLRDGDLRDAFGLEVDPGSRTPIVEESVRTGLAHYSTGQSVAVRLTLRSEIPSARGLKSSSAVSCAVLRAVAFAAGHRPSALELARLSAEVSRRVGISATGAFDDALAGLEPGFLVTDNARGELLRHDAIDPDWGVALYVPARPHPPSPTVHVAFGSERASGERSASAALEGDWARAMELNTELVERTMGYAYRELRARLTSRGAVASGVSGLGPALAAIAPVDRLTAVLREFPEDDAQRFVVRFTCPGGSTGESP